MVIRRFAIIALAAIAACEEPWATEDLAALDTPVSFSSLTVGYERSCGLDAVGHAWCWGTDAASTTLRDRCVRPPIIGMGSEPEPCWSRPAPVAGDHSFTVLKHGGVGNQTWGIDASGRLWVWGSNRFYMIRATDANLAVDRPRQVDGLESTRFIAIDGSTTTACAITEAGTMLCWGEPNMVTTTTPAANTICTQPGGWGNCGIDPFQVGTATDWVDVAVGNEHACGLNSAGRIACFGFGASGVLGVTSTPTCNVGGFAYRCSSTPLVVSTTLTFTSISSDGNMVCGITSTAALYCWGALVGSTPTLTPTQLGTSIADVEVLSPGYCAVRTNGTVICTTMFSGDNVPLPIAVSGAMIGIAAEREHACVWNAVGAAWCFGENTMGQLGDGAPAIRYNATPYAVAAPYRY